MWLSQFLTFTANKVTPRGVCAFRKSNCGSIFMQTFSACPSFFKQKTWLLPCGLATQSYAAFRSLKLELVENPFHVKDFQKTLLYSMLVYRKPGLYVSSLLLDSISACEFLCRCEQHLIDGRKAKMASILTFPKGLFTIALASVHFFIFCHLLFMLGQYFCRMCF